MATPSDTWAEIRRTCTVEERRAIYNKIYDSLSEHEKETLQWSIENICGKIKDCRPNAPFSDRQAFEIFCEAVVCEAATANWRSA